MIKVSKEHVFFGFVLFFFSPKLYYFFHYVISSSQHIFIYDVKWGCFILDSLRSRAQDRCRIARNLLGMGGERKKNGNRSMWWESSAHNKVLIHVKGKKGELIQHLKDRSPYHLSVELPQILSPHLPLTLLRFQQRDCYWKWCGNNLTAGSLKNQNSPAPTPL